MSRQYSRYSQPVYQPASPGGYQDDHPASSSPPPHHAHQQGYHQQQTNHASRYDPDPHEYDNPFHTSEARYEDHLDSNRGYSDDQFNVASDFNNQGPRYGELYGGQSRQEMAQLAAGARPTSLYNPLATTTSHMDEQSLYSNSGMTKASGGMKKPLLGNTNGGGGQGETVELVTVPALGAEWSKNELYSQTRRAKQEARREKRGKMWREWNRDQRGCCGVGWMTKRMLVVVTFAFIAALGVTLYFVIPRAPSFDFPSDTVFLADNSTVGFSRTPANFSFTGDIRMIADASSSWLPVHFNDLEITVLDMNTNKKIGTGHWKDKTIGRKDPAYLTLPVDFSYSAVNATDSTWSGMYNACGHRWTGTQRPDLSFRVTLKMNIRGLVGKPTVSRLATDLECPFELPSNSV